METPKGRGMAKTKVQKQNYGAKLEFIKRWEGANPNIFWQGQGGVWIFSVTHPNPMKKCWDQESLGGERGVGTSPHSLIPNLAFLGNRKNAHQPLMGSNKNEDPKNKDWRSKTPKHENKNPGSWKWRPLNTKTKTLEHENEDSWTQKQCFRLLGNQRAKMNLIEKRYSSNLYYTVVLFIYSGPVIGSRHISGCGFSSIFGRQMRLLEIFVNWSIYKGQSIALTCTIFWHAKHGEGEGEPQPPASPPLLSHLWQ